MSILDNIDDYKYWRDNKLENASSSIQDCIVEISNPENLSSSEKSKIKSLCDNNNFALFTIPKQDDYQDTINSINHQFDLDEFDEHLYVGDKGLASIANTKNKQQGEFIPYTNKAIGWHSDGYYNSYKKRIRAFSLFCASPAKAGGSNSWIDPHMIYIHLYEDNPDMVKALTNNKAMTIPEHKIDGLVRREISIGPIFFIDDMTNELYIRYTQRKKNIEFANSTEVRQAVEILDNFLASNSIYHFNHTMQEAQGMLCNNVLHNRSGFTDDPNKPRLMLRGRFFSRI